MNRTCIALVLAATFFAAPVRADDAADAAWEAQTKAEIAYFKKNAKRAKDDAAYAELLMAVADTQHPLAARFLGDMILKDNDIEHQLMAASSLSEFNRSDASRVAAGDAIVKALEKGKKLETEVIDTAVDTAGKLKHEPAVPIICEILKKGGDPYLLVTGVRALGRIDSWKALPTLLELWERHPVGVSWDTGGEVRVDTGAAGTADQEAAEAQWNAENAGKGPAGKPPMMLKVYIQELAKTCSGICDKEISEASELRAWMVERRKELLEMGVDIPKYKGATKDKDGLDRPDEDTEDEKGKKDDEGK